MWRDVSIIIPTKSEALLTRAIRSVLRTHGALERCEFIVVDDGLTVRPALCDGLTYVSGLKPFCFARNVNLGIEKARANSDILLMNDDVYLISTNALIELQRVVMENERLGIVTPVFAGSERTPCQRLGHLNLDDKVWLEKRSYLTFATAYIRRELLDEIGTLDERFVGYGYEDNDYCLRAVCAKFEIGVSPRAIAGHGDEFGKGSMTYRSSPMIDLIAFNREIFIRKWATNLLGLGEEQCDTLLRLVRFL